MESRWGGNRDRRVLGPGQGIALQSGRAFHMSISAHLGSGAPGCHLPTPVSSWWITFSFYHMAMLDIIWNNSRDCELYSYHFLPGLVPYRDPYKFATSGEPQRYVSSSQFYWLYHLESLTVFPKVHPFSILWWIQKIVHLSWEILYSPDWIIRLTFAHELLLDLSRHLFCLLLCLENGAHAFQSPF